MSIHPAVKYWRDIEISKTKYVLRNLSIAEPILDLGCGDGEIAKIVFNTNIIVGIDKIKTPHGLIMDATNIKFSDGYFGTVYSNCVLEHIPDIKTVIKEVYRVLKPKGKFIFTVPTERFKHYLLFSWIPGYGWLRNKHLHHYHCLTYSQWIRLILDAGFKDFIAYDYISREQAGYWDKLCWGHKLHLTKFCKREPKTIRSAQKCHDFGAARLVVARKP